MARTIKSIAYTWLEDNVPYGGGYTVGMGGVSGIEEHAALGEGDKWYYDVHFEDGTMNREFTVTSVAFGEDDNG